MWFLQIIIIIIKKNPRPQSPCAYCQFGITLWLQVQMLLDFEKYKFFGTPKWYDLKIILTAMIRAK
jgi:hypothetical protein